MQILERLVFQSSLSAMGTMKPATNPQKTRPKARFSWKRETAYLDSTRAISRHLLE
jgi:hypothetical protein